MPALTWLDKLQEQREFRYSASSVYALKKGKVQAKLLLNSQNRYRLYGS